MGGSATRLTIAASLMPWAAVAVFGRQVPAVPDYAADVAPIFRAHCSPCHTGGQSSGGLSLASYETLIKAGVVTVGDAKASVLVQRILGEGGLPRMPMGFKPLADQDVRTIQAWIAGGAKPPASVGRTHWAFVVPKKAPVPKVGPWAVNAVDGFILDRLRREGLRPSPPTDKTTLIRRVTLDLIGLPPTQAEVRAFLDDRSPNAYEKVVDRLLANPHYGERMALPWLDAARYADSNGFQQDGDTYQYVWRDWVVRALNANMPFDRFTIEQLAGDLLPKPTLDQLVATGFNRNHMLNGEGGAIPEEQRFVNLFDRVDTTSSTWLGLTMGCARCHDHKYDPLTQRDYYAMMAYFNKVPETGVPSGSGQYRIADPWVYAGTPDQMAALAKLEANATKAKAAERTYMSGSAFKGEFSRWRQTVQDALANVAYRVSPWVEVGTFVGASFDDAYAREFGPEVGRDAKAIERPELVDGAVHPLNGDNTAFYFRRVVHVDRPAPYLLSLGSDDAIRVWLDRKEVLGRKVTRGVTPDSDRVIVQLHVGDNEILIKVVNGGGIGGFTFLGLPGGVDAATAELLKSETSGPVKLEAVFARDFPSAELKTLRNVTSEAESSLAKLRGGLPRVMVMSDAQPRKTYILHRGNYEEPTDPVDPATPSSLPRASEARNRLGLAKWIVSPSNPLASRVVVNRAWQLFFGRGLVRTEENFGVKGEPPTHPELLDWLAVDLRENGWNVKRLHKQIVMSATYRQASKVSPQLLQKDPDNRLYARASRFRLPSMILRDVALAASGLLDPRIGGKPVYPYQPKGIWDGLAITLERDFTYPQSKGPDNFRRSLYTFWRRTAAPGNMFDSSSRQVCTVKPSLTSTPLHALTMLNDVTWVEAGAALASSVGSLPAKQALVVAFERVCARKPEPTETAVLERALNRALKAYRSDPKAAEAYLAQGEFRPNKKTPELAALAAVCTTIFNLDEAMTRE